MTRGRPPATAPRGRVTLAEASEISGLTRQEIHRRIQAGLVPGEQDARGFWTITRQDAEGLERRPPPSGPRVAVQLRPYKPRYKAWEREAKRQGKPVSTLAMELLDLAAGWTNGDE